LEANELSARTRTLGQLANIVQAMRTLASAQRRQAQDRFFGLERYAAATQAALGEALALLGALGEAPPEAPTGARRVVVLLSEHGFVGALNDRVLDLALSLSHSRAAELVALGSRGRRLCRERAVDATDGGAMPTTVAAAQATAERLIEELFVSVAADSLSEIHLVFAEHRPPLGWEPGHLQIFPPDVSAPARSATADEPPIHTLEPRILVVRAIEEYAFARVSWAVGSAFASERAARFVAMDAAHRHIDDKLSELQALERSLRQETITNEILEIALGAESSAGTQ
jgi:F-type H+-transporting ATPase subunit gamma